VNEAADAPRKGCVRAIVMVLIGVPVAMACALGISLLIDILAVRTLVLLIMSSSALQLIMQRLS
jgi:hypothetical protein